MDSLNFNFIPELRQNGKFSAPNCAFLDEHVMLVMLKFRG